MHRYTLQWMTHMLIKTTAASLDQQRIKGVGFRIARLIVCLTLVFTGCSTDEAADTAGDHTKSSPQSAMPQVNSNDSAAPHQEQNLALRLRPSAKIGGVIRAIFEDSDEVLWIGGEGDLFRIDENAVTSYALKDNRGKGVTVKQIVEQTDGTIWCGTTGGITKIEGSSFTSFGEEDGLLHRDVWSLAADKDGMLWIGTIEGVCRFDGDSFSKFELPKSKPDPTRGITSDEIVHCITVDSQQRIWFGTNGGAYRYDGKTLTRISREDGLPGEVVHNIIEDTAGNMWIGTTHHGICRFDGRKSVNFTANGIVEGEEIWCLHEDRTGNIWFSGKHFGVYRYDGTTFDRFDKRDGLDSPGLMCILEDARQRMWLGGVGGLFRYQNGRFTSITENGPWE